MLQRIVSALALAVLTSFGLPPCASAADKPEPTKKDTAKKDKDEARPAGPGNVEELLKKLQGLDRDRLKQMKQTMEEYRKMMDQSQGEMRKAMEQYRKALEELNRQLPGRFMPNVDGFGGRRLAATRSLAGDVPRLGAQLTRPAEALVDQLNPPEGKGLVIEQLKDDSAAAKGGLKLHDILLELNGKSVPNELADFRKLLDDVKPDAKVDAKVIRKGKQETIKDLTLPEVKVKKLRDRGFIPRRPLKKETQKDAIHVLEQEAFVAFMRAVAAPQGFLYRTTMNNEQ